MWIRYEESAIWRYWTFIFGKGKCGVNNPEAIQDLKTEIYAAIAAPEIIENVLTNWVDRKGFKNSVTSEFISL